MKKITFALLLFIVVSCSEKKYEILKKESDAGICRIQVGLTEKVEENELQEIAEELKSNYENCTKLWLSFYLPDLPPDADGNGAWAVASFTPEFEVNILGKKIAAESEETPVSFPKYLSIEEMLNASGDYKDNCFEDLSDGDVIHVRVSSEFLNTEDTSLVKEETKRDIVYVIFQTFAQTDLNKVTVTAIPIIRTSFNPSIEYNGEKKEELKLTVTVTRDKAQNILEKYLPTTSFKDLYQLQNTVYVPSAKFDRLKFSELQNVYADLK